MNLLDRKQTNSFTTIDLQRGWARQDGGGNLSSYTWSDVQSIYYYIFASNDSAKQFLCFMPDFPWTFFAY